MALIYVGGTSGSRAGSSSANTTVSLTSLSGGAASSPSEGDIVIVGLATGSYSDRNLNLVTSGYTRLCDLYAEDFDSCNLFSFVKVMGSTPDTSVVAPPSGSSSDALTVVIHVWRSSTGKNILTDLVTTATGNDDYRPKPPAITPTESGSVVICIGAAGGTNAFTSSDLSNFFSLGKDDNYDSTSGIGSYSWTTGTFTPARWGGGSFVANDMWCAVSFVIYEESTSTNFQINIGDAWKSVESLKINIGDEWKVVSSVKINIGDIWKTIF